MLNVLPLTLWSNLRTFMDADISATMPQLGRVGIVIAATLCAFSVLKVAYDYIMGNSQGNYWGVLRPVVLLCIVCTFNTVVLKPFSGIVNIITRDMAATCNSVGADYWEKMQDNSLRLADIQSGNVDNDYQSQLKEIENDTSVTGRFFMKIWLWLKKVLKHFLNITSLSVGTIISSALFLLAKVLMFVQQMLAALYITILGLIGPIIFAFAILPSFESGIKSWIARYIQIAMWIPIGYIVMTLNLKIGTTIAYSVNPGGAALSAEWFMIANQIVTIVSIAAVPKISAWIVESTGANDAHAALSQPARTASRKLFKM